MLILPRKHIIGPILIADPIIGGSLLSFQISNIIHHTLVVLFKYSSKRSNNILGECRTLWGKREQAMHYSIDCYAAKSLPMKYLDSSAQAIHAWHVAKMKFVANSTVYRVLNSLE